jgi:hypothetical protein
LRFGGGAQSENLGMRRRVTPFLDSIAGTRQHRAGFHHHGAHGNFATIAGRLGLCDGDRHIRVHSQKSTMSRNAQSPLSSPSVRSDLADRHKPSSPKDDIDMTQDLFVGSGQKRPKFNRDTIGENALLHQGIANPEDPFDRQFPRIARILGIDQGQQTNRRFCPHDIPGQNFQPGFVGILIATVAANDMTVSFRGRRTMPLIGHGGEGQSE